MEVMRTRGHRSDVLTLRRLSVTLAAAALVGSSFSPASADPLPLTTWIVTYDQAPTSYQVEVLRGVSDAVHGFREVPAAVVVAPTAAASLLRALPGVRGVY